MIFNGTIVITDPCYIFNTEDWDKYCINFDPSFIRDLGFTQFIWEDTLYGDWSCGVFEEEKKEPIGTFCADAGLVGVFYLDEVEKYNPKLINEYGGWCYTIIRDFHGDVEYFIDREEEAHIRGIGNINFTTYQTAP